MNAITTLSTCVRISAYWNTIVGNLWEYNLLYAHLCSLIWIEKASHKLKMNASSLPPNIHCRMYIHHSKIILVGSVESLHQRCTSGAHVCSAYWNSIANYLYECNILYTHLCSLTWIEKASLKLRINESSLQTNFRCRMYINND